MANDTFAKWMMSVTATITVALVGGIFSTILSLKEDMALVKEQVATVKTNVDAVRDLQFRVQDHENRLRWIESGRANNHQSTTSVRRVYAQQDTNGVHTYSP